MVINNLCRMKTKCVLCLLLLTIACNSLNYRNDVIYHPDSGIAKSLSFENGEEAAISAVNELVQLIDNNQRRGIKRSIANSYYLETLSDPYEGDILSKPVYVINFQDNAGFAIASADNSLPPVLCVTDTGHFYVGDALPLGAIAMLSRLDVSSDDNQRSELEPWNIYPPDSVYIFWTTISTGTIHGTQVGSRWGQKPKFNRQCPLFGNKRALAGCVPVAVGQIMYYYGKNVVYDGYSYNWSILHNVVDTLSCPNYLAAWTGVAKLIKTLGNAENLNATYGVNGTPSNDAYIPRTFENFGYTNGGTQTTYNFWGLSTEIVHNKPAIVVGYRKQYINSYAGGVVSQSDTLLIGHAWVVDQFVSALRHVTVYNRNTWEVLYSADVEQHFLHCNWGWNGSYNGFFVSGEFDITSPLVFETKSPLDTLNEYTYKYNLKQYTGIRP